MALINRRGDSQRDDLYLITSGPRSAVWSSYLDAIIAWRCSNKENRLRAPVSIGTVALGKLFAIRCEGCGNEVNVFLDHKRVQELARFQVDAVSMSLTALDVARYRSQLWRILRRLSNDRTDRDQQCRRYLNHDLKQILLHGTKEIAASRHCPTAWERLGGG